jgi:hypothetical protein
MKLVGILTRLRAQMTMAIRYSRKERIYQTLQSGLTVEARADDTWLLSRPNVKPSNTECETIARDAGIRHGFSVATSQGRTTPAWYRLLTPLDDDESTATGVLCPDCEGRSLRQPSHCPECGHGTTEARVPATVSAEEHAIFELANVARADMRPGEPLPMTLQLKEGILYHFEAFGRVWGASYAPTRAMPIWCSSLEPLEGPGGAAEFNSMEAFKTWFRQSGQHPPITAPARWAGAA